MTFLILLAVTIVFGVLRFVLPVAGEVNKKDIYKDLAHIWVGILLGLAIGTISGRLAADEFPVDWLAWSLPVGITILEVVAFVVRKKPATPAG